MSAPLDQLNAAQRQAVTHGDGPLLIVAGAGTGKTTVIAQRVAWLVEQELAKSDEILVLTFTEKAATELEERIDRLLPYGVIDAWISTFHSFAERLLKLHGVEIGLPNNFKLLTTTEQWLLLRQNFDRFNLDHYRPLGNPTKFIHAILKLISRAKDELITPQQYLDFAEQLRLNADDSEFIGKMKKAKVLTDDEIAEGNAQEIKKNQEVADAYHTYQQLLREIGALDFGDLITETLRLLKERPAVLAAYRQQFKYILVDEFQDTNYAQYELIKLLAAPRNNVTVVGDDDQSIYKFRGASVSNILQFKDQYSDATQVVLTTNYRSAQNILDLSYAFIQQNNPDRLEVKLASDAVPLSKKLQAANANPGVIEHLHFATENDEVVGVLERIAAAKAADANVSWNDFAILCRTNDVASTFAQALGQTDMPYQFVASRGLYFKPIVLEVVSYLRLLDNYHESSAVYRTLSSRIVGLSPETIMTVSTWARRKGYSLFEALQQPEAIVSLSPEARAKIQLFLSWVERHSRLVQQQSVSKVVMAFLQDTKYLDQFQNIETAEALQATTYLNQLYKKITEFERAVEHPTVKHFLELIELEVESGDDGSLPSSINEGPEAIKVMTVHAAKGLEFAYVFVASLVDRRFPVDDRSDPIVLPTALVKEVLPSGDAHLQEERRLLYVAMTRAKAHLYFTTAEDYGGARKKKVSKFLLELEKTGFPLQTASRTTATGIETAAGASEPVKVAPADIRALLPKEFYFSQLRAFTQCPYHYWLQYVLQLPLPSKPSLSFGSSIHATLQYFFEQVQARANVGQQQLFATTAPDEKATPSVTLDELLELYQNEWIDDWYPTRKLHDEYFAEGKKILKQFYAQYVEELPTPKFLECKFKLPLRDGDETYMITGKIDRIDPLDGGVEILDYKTGVGKTKESFSTDDKQQLLMYQLAARDVLHEDVKQLTYYYLTTGEKISFVGSDEDLEKLKQKMITTIQNIYATPFPLTPADCTCHIKDLRTL